MYVECVSLQIFDEIVENLDYIERFFPNIKIVVLYKYIFKMYKL